jgi:5,10-methylenetetrahydromethanopterin reductase
MEIGFFFWPFNVALTRKLAALAESHGYDMIGIADTPGNAMDPWVSATIVAQETTRPRVAICVTNLASRHPAVSAAAIASIDAVSGGRAVLGIGAGHSGTKNIGVTQKTTATMLGEGVSFIKQALTGNPVEYHGGTAQLPWVKRAPKVFLAASHPKSLQQAAAHADGVFINYGIGADNIRQSETLVNAVKQAGRKPEDVEIWQIAALDCNVDGNVARAKLGAMLAFLNGYVIGTKNLDQRGVPAQYHEPLLELRRRYSTSPGEADIKLVRELGLFDYLSHRLAICGTPDECLEQLLAAKAAGAKRLMFTVSLAADPCMTVDLFAKKVFPLIRAAST